MLRRNDEGTVKTYGGWRDSWRPLHGVLPGRQWSTRPAVADAPQISPHHGRIRPMAIIAQGREQKFASICKTSHAEAFPESKIHKAIALNPHH